MKNKLILLILIFSSCTKEIIYIEDTLDELLENTKTESNLISEISTKTYTLSKESYFNQKSGMFFSWADNGSREEEYLPIMTNTKNTVVDWYNAGQSYHDINGDGYQDILVSSSNKNEESFFQWYINNGDNKHFTSDESVIKQSTDGYTSHKFIKTDVNNDNIADFVAFGVDERIQGDYTGNLTILIGDSDGKFDVNNIPNPNRYWFHGGAAGDLNQDGFVDLIGADYIWWGDGSGNFTQDDFEFFKLSEASLSFEILDMNNDGFNDIVIGTQTEYSQDFIILNNGSGFNETNEIVYLPKTNFSGIMDIEIVDIDNDGDLDIVECRMNNDSVSYLFLYENNNFNFTVNEKYFENSNDGNFIHGEFDFYGWSRFKFDDIDGDGIDDIITENYQDGIYNGLKNIDGIWKKYEFKFGK